MTGTAKTEAQEFSQIYKLEVAVVPTNVPTKRVDNADVVFGKEAGAPLPGPDLAPTQRITCTQLTSFCSSGIRLRSVLGCPRELDDCYWSGAEVQGVGHVCCLQVRGCGIRKAESPGCAA